MTSVHQRYRRTDRHTDTCHGNTALCMYMHWALRTLLLFLISLYHNCDSTTIRLRYDDTTTHDYDTTTTKNRAEWKQARAIRRSRIVVVSQSNRTYIVISIISVAVDCVVVSSYRSRIVAESQL